MSRPGDHGSRLATGDRIKGGAPFACASCTPEGCACSDSRKSASQRCSCSSTPKPDGQAGGELRLCDRCAHEQLGGCGDGRGFPACQESRVFESGEQFLASFDEPKGDPDWWEAWAELHPLHVEKASTYGTDTDALANYVNTSTQLGQPDEYTPMARIIEKLERARNLVLAGRADEVKEWPDIAALALGAEALRRRRL